MRAFRLFLAAAAAFWSAAAFAQGLPEPAAVRDPPSLAALVSAGKLPPLAERLPANPRVIDVKSMGRAEGRHGGTLRMLMGDQRDIRFITVYGYTRLVTYNEKLELGPDLLESFHSENDTVFTFKLRPGHKWSDGQPFTSEDFRYYWEDVANNARLSPSGPPPSLTAGGLPCKFEVIDALTIRYTFSQPNPLFLGELAAAQPLYLYMPSHYMRKFHEKYGDPKFIQEQARAARVRDWGALHERNSRQYRPENPDMPMLDAWLNRTKPPSEQFTFERNPFYHRVDSAGRQLPYIDNVIMRMGTTSLIPAKASSGESDLQARYIRFDSYTFLKESEKRIGYKVRLWERGEGAFIAILPNYNVGDPAWRKLIHDARFRRALSLGVDRHEINQVIFYGLARPSANTLLPSSPLHRKEYEQAYARFDADTANKLLDEAGLAKRDDDGIRLIPDGRRAEITIDTAGENTEESDALELVRDSWARIGIKMFIRPTQREVMRKRITGGKTAFSAWSGLDNGVATAAMDPEGLAPSGSTMQIWPLWHDYVESRGQKGEAPDMASAKELVALHRAWKSAASHSEREAVWHKMLALHASEVFTIGLVNGTLQPVVVSNKLRNVPEKGLFNFAPMAFFGVYMPDTFWFDSQAK